MDHAANINHPEAFFSSIDYNNESSQASQVDQNIRDNQPKRRFPGPAGILPAMSGNEVRQLSDANHPLSQQINEIISQDVNKQIRMSRPPEQRISRAPWRELVRTLALDPNDPEDILSLMNIKWMKSLLSKSLISTKIPFLALVVQQEPDMMVTKRGDSRRNNPSIKLMDRTGSVIAALDPLLIEKFASELVPGTAIAVKNIGYLKFKKHKILTITRKNVICIISKKTCDVTEKRMSFLVPDKVQSRKVLSTELDTEAVKFETNEGVIVRMFCDFSKAEVMSEYRKALNLLNEATLEIESRSEENSSPQQINRSRLFNTVPQRPFVNPVKRPLPLPVEQPPRKIAQVDLTRSPVQSREPGLNELSNSNSDSHGQDDDQDVFNEEDDAELMQALDFLFEDIN